MGWIAQLRVLGEVAVAMVLGALLGLEREAADKPAGLRTHMLVAGTSALLVRLGDFLLGRIDGAAGARLNSDPIRIAQAIIIGIGFLGAGTIIQRGRSDRVEGLTTGATLLLASALGMCVAVGQYLLAFGTTFLALVVLVALGVAEKTLPWRKRRGDASALTKDAVRGEDRSG